MTTTKADRQGHISWLQHRDIRGHLESGVMAGPWFSALHFEKSVDHQISWFSALVPPQAVPTLCQKDGWDIGAGDGRPSIWTHYEAGEAVHRYCPFGNEEGIEPLVAWRSYNGMRPAEAELTQEFRLFHNLYHDAAQKRYLYFEENGDETVAVRYGPKRIEILLRFIKQFCAAKQMALAVYVESFRYSRLRLEDLGLAESRTVERGATYCFPLTIVPADNTSNQDFQTWGLVVGGKKYIAPDPMLDPDQPTSEKYPDFIIGTSASGETLRHTCNPGRLEIGMTATVGAPGYLTPVFFRPEVLSKYYNEPAKYSVEDGYLRCGGLWGMRIDNDSPDVTVVWLGDLGRDLPERERDYWLSFNIASDGRTISLTSFQRDFMAEPVDPNREDHVFKTAYSRFASDFREQYAWDLFKPLHADDAHNLSALRFLAKDNQAEFDTQVLSLAKLLVDSLNEAKITVGVSSIDAYDKGITKLEKFLVARGLTSYEPHIDFLRQLQKLRSSSSAHRKGGNYEQIAAMLALPDAGHQRVFAALLSKGTALLRYLRASLLVGGQAGATR